MMQSMRTFYMIGFVDHVAVSLIVPSLPTFIKSLNSGPMMIGVVSSLYGGIQMASSPIIGSVSDLYGRRHVLLLSVVGAFFGYLVLGFSTTIWMVLLSRIPCGLFKHTSDTMKLCIADHCPGHLRASTLGKLNAYSSLGFMIGPAIGGYISSFPGGFHMAAKLTAVLFLFNYAITFYFVPKPVVDHVTDVEEIITFKDTDDNQATKHPNSSIKGVNAMLMDKLKQWKLSLMSSGNTRSLLGIRLLTASSAIIVRSHFMLVLEEKFNVNSEYRGYILSYMGFIAMCCNFLVGPLVAWVESEVLLLQASIIGLGISFFFVGYVISINHLLIVLIPQLLSVSIVRACMTSVLSNYVRSDLLGGVLGISSSLASIARVVSPIISGFLMEMSYNGPAFGGAFLALLCGALFWFLIYSEQRIVQKKP